MHQLMAIRDTNAWQPMSRVGLAVMMQRQGWVHADVPIAFRSLGAPLEFIIAWVASGSNARMTALLLREGIFAKGISSILGVSFF